MLHWKYQQASWSGQRPVVKKAAGLATAWLPTVWPPCLSSISSQSSFLFLSHQLGETLGNSGLLSQNMGSWPGAS